MKTYYNHEGYPDPTAGQAVENVTKSEKRYIPLVYICSPYKGDVENNTRRARDYSKFAISKGCLPLAPHLLYPQMLSEDIPGERELGLTFALILLSKCDELWIFGSHISDGMRRERHKAKRKGMPIRYFSDEEVYGK